MSAVDTGGLVLRALSGADAWHAELQRLTSVLPAAPAGGAATRRRIVMPRGRGADLLSLVRETLFAHALRLRGAAVTFVLDGDAPDGETARLTGCGHTVVRTASFLDHDTIETLRERVLGLPEGRLSRVTWGGITVQADACAPAEALRVELLHGMLGIESARRVLRDLAPDAVFVGDAHATGAWGPVARAMLVPCLAHGARPFEPLHAEGREPVALALDSLQELAPGHFPGLDALCDAVLAFAAPEADLR